MEEAFFSGYCRCIDQSRLVTAELYQGTWQADCSYPDCPYATSCQIAQKLQALTTAAP